MIRMQWLGSVCVMHKCALVRIGLDVDFGYKNRLSVLINSICFLFFNLTQIF